MSEENQQCDTTPGIFGWNELLTPGKAASMEFYSGLFGWSTEDIELPDGKTYTMFKLGERPVGGCYQIDDDAAMPPAWLSYVNVNDLDAKIAKARELGATMVMERMDLPVGSFAIIADPQGAVIAFWQGTGECS